MNERAASLKHSKLVFLQAAEAATICQAKISQAIFVKTLTSVFCQAADAAKICQAKGIRLPEHNVRICSATDPHQAVFVKTSKLIFHQAAVPYFWYKQYI